MSIARRMWMLTEPIHAVVYFAPEHRQAQDAAGLKGGWMAYFASRAAPLGAAPAESVTAAFYNFAPAMVRRAIPDAWRFASPERVLQARSDGVARALARVLGARAGDAALPAAVTALRRAVDGCDVAGRPLFAANAALPWPDRPLPALWHATTLLREFRGDGHVAALLTHEIDGCEAHVLAAASGATTTEQLRGNRGWTDLQWHAAVARLHDRGLVKATGAFTGEGRRLHAAIERQTDHLAAPPWDHLGQREVARLAGTLAPLLEAVEASGTVPYPNPIGLPRPGWSPSDAVEA